MSEVFRTPRSEPKLVEVTDALIEGARTYGSALSLSPDLAAAMTTDRDALGVARNQHKENKETVRTARSARRVAEKEAFAYVVIATDVLRPKFGTRRNPQWELVGLRPGSTAKPVNRTETLARLQALEAYFTANPASEVPGLEVTATKAATLQKAVVETNTALARALTESRTSKRLREEAKRRLAARARSFAETLTAVLSPADERWYGFRLRRPVDIRIPEIPAAPMIEQTGPGEIRIDIPRATRAKRYRVYLQQLPDEEPKVVATVTDRFALLKNLPTETTLKIQVSAINKSGESRPSEAVALVLQTREMAHAKREPDAHEHAALDNAIAGPGSESPVPSRDFPEPSTSYR